MKVLRVHNAYRRATPSGENTVFDAEGELLASAGHTVERFTRSNDEISQAPLRIAFESALLGTHNPVSTRALAQRLHAFSPDVVHVHNTFPLLSPAVLEVARRAGAAVVATLHNYRLVCMQGGYLREQHICTECLDQHSALPGVRHGCYRGRVGSLPVAATLAWHRRAGTWSREPHALIALTEFQKSMMQRAGLPAERLHVKGNFAAAATPMPFEHRDPVAVFVGRLSAEKGLHTLVDAWQLLGAEAPRLRIVGGGEGLKALRARIAAAGLESRIDLLGAQSHAQAMAEVSRARLLVFPSIWYEPFGMALVEAYARGVPVLASRLGSLPDLVPDTAGVLFEPGDARALSQSVAALWRDPVRLQRLSEGAHRLWSERHAPAQHLDQLEHIYAAALARRDAASRSGPPPRHP